MSLYQPATSLVLAERELVPLSNNHSYNYLLLATNSEPEPITIPSLSSSSPIEEHMETKIEEEESEAERYWRTHPSRVRPNNNKVKFVVEGNLF